MLINFIVNNFRGFNLPIEWCLSHPNNYEFNTYAIKDGIIKNGLIYGPNGCGKTNFSLALFDIVNHISQKIKKADYYNNFIYAGTPDTLVNFEYTFKFDKEIVEYKYSKQSDGKLIEENLIVDGKTIFEKKNNSFVIDSECFAIENQTKDALAINANGVSIINFLLTSFPLTHDHYLIKLRNFVDGMLWFRNLDIREFIGLENTISNLDEFIIKEHLHKDFESFLNSVSGQKFEFDNNSENDRMLMCKIGNNRYPFILIASTGTKALQLLYFWMKKIVNASFVFIDEFDAFYHFDLSFKVCKRLFTQNCQVFASTHNTYLLSNELLRPDCNFLLNNNKIKSFSDCTQKELRIAHNMEKLYRGGTFNI